MDGSGGGVEVAAAAVAAAGVVGAAVALPSDGATVATAASGGGNPLVWLPLTVAVAIPLAFVGVLYAVPAAVRALPRDHPTYITARFGMVGWLALCVPAVVAAVAWILATQPGATGALAQTALDTALGLHPYCNAPASVLRPLAVIVLLFAGPLTQAALLAAAGLPTVFSRLRLVCPPRGTPPCTSSGSSCISGSGSGGGGSGSSGGTSGSGGGTSTSASDGVGSDVAARLIVWRTVAVAPVTEEWVFRCCLLPLYLLGGLRPLPAVLVTAASFGAAHLHLAGELARSGYTAGEIAVQLGGHLVITSLFGSLAGGMLYASGSFLAVAGMHVFCNIMGPPTLAWWVYPTHPLYPKRALLAAAHLGGIVASVVAASPLLLLSAPLAVHAATFPCALMLPAALP